MKHILFLFVAALMSTTIFAQQPGWGGGFSQGSIAGKVVDSSGQPMSGVPVYLLSLTKDSLTGKTKELLYKSLVTSSNGSFSQDEIPLRTRIKVKISPLGYTEVDSVVQFFKIVDGKPAINATVNLGAISLVSSASDLQAVVVTSTSSNPAFKMEIDKKVFNVEKNIASTGGTALDVLKNVPSIQVDIDGNVKMRNASPQIYVDGRPSTLTPDQIPSDAVQSVEIMTNPSAKYDASGGNAGILNIVLKKNRKMGYNGNLRAGVDRFGGINAGADLNVRQGKFNFSASGMYNQNKGKTTGTTDRTNIGTTPTALHQNSIDKDNGGFMFGKVGVDYFMDDNTTWSLSGIKVHGSMKPYGSMDILSDTLDAAGSVLNRAYSRRYTNSDRTFNGNGLTLGVKHLFDKPNQQLTADFNYFGGNGDFNSLYNTNYYANGYDNSSTGYQLQNMINNGNMRHITAQTDYSMPIGEKGKFEAGLRAQLQRSDFYNYNALGVVNSSDLSNPYSSTVTSYLSHNNVYAAYATYTNSLGKFGYQVGLRAERSNYDGTLKTTGEKFSNKYPVNLFPTIYLTQDLKGDQQLQFTFTRRINRPNFFQLMPITDYTDTLNITRGNPDLRPEFTNKFELGYMKTFNRNNVFMASAYYSRTTGLLTRYITQDSNQVSGKLDLINTYINANSSYSVGLELTTTNTLNKWWDLNANVNIYKSKINAGDDVVQNAMWSWYGKVNNTFKLPAQFSVQLSVNYQSKTNLPVNDNKGMGFGPPMAAQSSSQGYIKAFWSNDLAVKKEFFKDKRLSATLAASDIFRTNKNTQYSESAYFTQMYSRLRNPQMLRLTVAYRFGKVDMNLFKRKNMNSGAGMSDAMQGM